MLTFPNAKINLGLNIIEKRPDGYHNLETVFYPVPIEDALEINLSDDKTAKYRLYQSGLKIDGDIENNLVVKAYKLLDADFNLPAIDIHLFKHIPFGAGLGGGSSDAAFMLLLLNNTFKLNLTTQQLEDYARYCRLDLRRHAFPSFGRGGVRQGDLYLLYRRRAAGNAFRVYVCREVLCDRRRCRQR